jgi:hypothetical protein
MTDIVHRIFGKRMIALTLIVLTLIGLIFVSDYRRWQAVASRVDVIDQKIDQAAQANQNAEFYNRQADQTRAITLSLIQALSEMTRNFKAMADMLTEKRKADIKPMEIRPIDAKPIKTITAKTNSFAILCTAKQYRVQNVGEYSITYRDVIPLRNCTGGH